MLFFFFYINNKSPSDTSVGDINTGCNFSQKSRKNFKIPLATNFSFGSSLKIKYSEKLICKPRVYTGCKKKL